MRFIWSSLPTAGDFKWIHPTPHVDFAIGFEWIQRCKHDNFLRPAERFFWASRWTETPSHIFSSVSCGIKDVASLCDGTCDVGASVPRHRKILEHIRQNYGYVIPHEANIIILHIQWVPFLLNRSITEELIASHIYAASCPPLFLCWHMGFQESSLSTAWDFKWSHPTPHLRFYVGICDLYGAVLQRRGILSESTQLPTLTLRKLSVVNTMIFASCKGSAELLVELKCQPISFLHFHVV
jgi:hypothetical protein